MRIYVWEPKTRTCVSFDVDTDVSYLVDMDSFVQEIGLHRIKHIERHSPDGFNSGYAGSGPADLALSILTDYVTFKMYSYTFPDRYYQAFKNFFIAPRSSTEQWTITSWEIEQFINKKEHDVNGS